MPVQPEIDHSGVATAPPVRDDARRVVVGSPIGTTIEWYDCFIDGTAATVFGPRLFPQVSSVAGTLAAFATFGAGFVARPIGGIVMADSFSPGLRATILPCGGNGPPPPCPHDE